MDAARLTFCGSSGLSTLVTTCQSLRAGGGRLAPAGTPALLARLLARTGLTTVFELYPSVAAAEAALAT
jgi:anti-anti-sigma factor